MNQNFNKNNSKPKIKKVYNLKKTKLIPSIILVVLFSSMIGAAVAWRGFINEFTGATHGGCHGSSKTVQSENGTLTISLTPGGDLTTDQAFTLQVTALLDFTEANLADYDGRVMIGLSGELGDNADFSRSLNITNQLFFEAEVPTNGSTTTERHGDPMIFDLIAPETVGNYEIVVCAISAANRSVWHPGYSYYNITFATGSIFVDVVAPSGPAAAPGTISGGLLAIIIGSTFAISTILVVRMRKRVRMKKI